MIGTVVGKDASSKPYLIKLDNGLISWYSSCSFRATDAKPKEETVGDVAVVEGVSADINVGKAEDIKQERIDEETVGESQVEPLLNAGAKEPVVSIEARRDTVEVVATGMIGTIVGHDDSSLHYLIKLDNGLVSWYSKDQFQARGAKAEDIPVGILQASPIVEYNGANSNVSWFCCK